MFEVLARHTEELVDLCGCSALWNTCKIMRQQSFMFPLADDVEGGSEIVSFQMACTGVTVCALFVSDDDTILTLKQQVALHLGHLPFAVVFWWTMKLFHLRRHGPELDPRHLCT